MPWAGPLCYKRPRGMSAIISDTDGKQFFFEKKNQKTFILVACASGKIGDSDIKVFCFFSSEKKALAPCRCSTGGFPVSENFARTSEKTPAWRPTFVSDKAHIALQPLKRDGAEHAFGPAATVSALSHLFNELARSGVYRCGIKA
jgi:hypothetical protein